MGEVPTRKEFPEYPLRLESLLRTSVPKCPSQTVVKYSLVPERSRVGLELGGLSRPLSSLKVCISWLVAGGLVLNVRLMEPVRTGLR